MPTELLIVPMGDGNVPNLLIDAEAGETFAYSSGTVDVQINDMIVQADESLPSGYDSILSTTALYDNADPPAITGYRVHALRSATVPRMFGGFTMIAPARAGLPLALVRVHSQQAVLDVLNTRLRAIVIKTTSGFYGGVPLTATATTRTNIADKLDELAADLLSPKPNVSAALTQAASDVRAITLAGWKAQFYDVLATLFQLPSRRSIEAAGVGEPNA